MKKIKFHLTPFWSDFITGTLATIVGIVLTVGIAYWQQNDDREDMAKKITLITLHNVDVRINQLDDAADRLAAKDSIFASVRDGMVDLEVAHPDSIRKDLDMLLFMGFHLTDTKSELIFSHSFEVWQYLDDPKVIGRTSNCYSMIDFSEELVDKFDTGISKALHDCRLKIIEQGIVDDPAEEMKMIVNDPQVILAFDGVDAAVRTLKGCAATARQLNDCNIQTLGFTKQELDEVGNLLPEEKD